METCFDSLLPIEPDSLSDWQAWFGIWGKTTTDEEMTAVRLAISEATHMYLKRVLDGAKARGELPQNLDSEMHGRRLQMILNGIASLAVINPSAWPAETQRAMFAAEIELMRQMPVIVDGPGAIEKSIAARA
ncbi:MAG: TetR family transcriptional regulator C-terminal domain-containing protein [Proteobacteria bacterium]|nr:TetR family transcriptional regulator C-terminal domain-containing protein [Pseudomonadota bacterium]